jgi:RimJ/RimL family protein N-acetyltransferase
MGAREQSPQQLRGDQAITSPAGSQQLPARVPRLPLVGRRVRLRAVSTADYDFLFDLATDDRVAMRWRYRSTPPRPDEFVRDLWQGVLAQFLVVHAETGERLGLVTAYNANARDGHCYIAVLFRPDASVWPVEGIVLFVNYLFAEFEFVKIYADVIEYNLPQLHSVVGRWMEREGVLRGHERHGGERWDVHVLALYRERFLRDADRLLRRIVPSS